MSYSFATLQVEVLRRGFDDLNDAGAGFSALKRWINEAMHELNAEERWDYLFTSTTGSAPLTIANLDRVESVADVAQGLALQAVDRAALVRNAPDLTVTGPAQYWYRTAPTTIAVFPVSTATLTVKYHKFVPDMTLDADVPAVPDRFCQAIVEKTCAKGFRADNAWQDAQACENEYSAIVARMRQSQLVAPQYMARTLYAGDD